MTVICSECMGTGEIITENERLEIEEKHDPWANKNKCMKCKTCRTFILKEGTKKGIGRCRKHAPTLGGFPVVFIDDWCGDHKLDENAI